MLVQQVGTGTQPVLSSPRAEPPSTLQAMPHSCISAEQEPFPIPCKSSGGFEALVLLRPLSTCVLKGVSPRVKVRHKSNDQTTPEEYQREQTQSSLVIETGRIFRCPDNVPAGN